MASAIETLQAGDVPTEELVIRTRVSKPLAGYTQATRTVAALQRAEAQGLAVHPGQDIEYVVVDDEKASRDRVALAHEDIGTYDAAYYETQVIRAAASVLSPLGWDQEAIRETLSDGRSPELAAFDCGNVNADPST